MELNKKNIHMNKIIENQVMQMTLDDDFNVQDVKPDVQKIIKAQSQINIANYKLINKKLMIEGDMSFTVLYISDEDGRIIHCISGKIPFEDSINMEKASVDDNIKVIAYVDDLSATMVNSRKISIRAVVTFECSAQNIYDVETAVGLEVASDEKVEYINEDVTVTQIAVNKKDICRIKEEIILPSSKQNVMEILYSDVTLLGTDTRPTQQGVSIKGSLLAFIMYASENGDIEFIEKEILFNNMIEVDGCSEEMIDDVIINLTSKDVSVKTDTDGEERILELDGALALDIKLYYEDKISVVKDFYGIDKEIIPIKEQGYYDNIILKNNCKFRVSDRIKVEDSQPALMQLCNSSVDIRIDSVEVMEDALNVEGVAQVTMLYVTNDDNIPINSFEGLVPFSQVIEVKGIDENSVYNVRPALEHCSVMMTDSRECEVKLAISVDTIVFGREPRDIITGVDYVEQEETQDAKIQDRPSMIGYVVKENDNLWDVAKKFKTTRECIKKMNFLESDEIKVGDRLLIV